MRSSAAEGRRFSAESLSALFADVVLCLNAIGYELEAPSLSLIGRFLGETTETDGEEAREIS